MDKKTVTECPIICELISILFDSTNKELRWTAFYLEFQCPTVCQNNEKSCFKSYTVWQYFNNFGEFTFSKLRRSIHPFFEQFLKSACFNLPISSFTVDCQFSIRHPTHLLILQNHHTKLTCTLQHRRRQRWTLERRR